MHKNAVIVFGRQHASLYKNIHLRAFVFPRFTVDNSWCRGLCRGVGGPGGGRSEIRGLVFSQP